MQTEFIETDAGIFTASFSENGLARLEFPRGQKDPRAAAPRASGQQRRWLSATARALHEALAGRPPGDLPPLDLSSGTRFQRSVWNALRTIPAGMTRSYAEVARAIGRPKAVRAVGQACGANPIPVLVPCHRVLAARGKLGGFSGGLEWKQELLAREGALPKDALPPELISHRLRATARSTRRSSPAAGCNRAG